METMIGLQTFVLIFQARKRKRGTSSAPLITEDLAIRPNREGERP
jgi:hypothetical protein